MKSLKFTLITSLLVTSVLSTGFGACSVSMRELCEARYPRLDQSVSDAMAALSPWRRSLSEGGRAPASERPLEPLDRAAWKLWAEERLKETQHYMDVIADEPSLRAVHEDLSQTANDLVTFHGYASSSRVELMVKMLNRINERTSRGRARACGEALANKTP